MRILLALLTIAFTALPLAAQSNVKTYTPKELEVKVHGLEIGEIVKIKFTSKGSTSTYSGNLTVTLYNSGSNYGSCYAIVPQEGIEWVSKLPSDDGPPKFVFAEVVETKRYNSKERTVKLIGAKASSPDIRGNVTYSW